MIYNMHNFADECVKVFFDLTGYDENKIKPAPTPSADESKDSSGVIDEEEGKIGELSSISAKCLMKVMYMARLARGDLLRAVGHLSTKITKWTKDCDAKLLRIRRYAKGSREFRQIGFIGDELKDLQLCLYTDADFASATEATSNRIPAFWHWSALTAFGYFVDSPKSKQL